MPSSGMTSKAKEPALPPLCHCPHRMPPPPRMRRRCGLLGKFTLCWHSLSPRLRLQKDWNSVDKVMKEELEKEKPEGEVLSFN